MAGIRSPDTAHSRSPNFAMMRFGVSISRNRPPRISAIRSQRRLVHIGRRYEDRDALAAQVWRASPTVPLRDTGSTPVVSSSRNSTDGLWISAQLSASFCFIPPESAPARRVRNGSI